MATVEDTQAIYHRSLQSRARLARRAMRAQIKEHHEMREQTVSDKEINRMLVSEVTLIQKLCQYDIARAKKSNRSRKSHTRKG